MSAHTEEVPILKWDLYEKWRNGNEPGNRYSEVLEFVSAEVGCDPDKLKEEDRMRLKSFCKHIQQKWVQCGYSSSKFEQKHSEWLDGCLHISKQHPTDAEGSFMACQPGRPKKDFSSLNEKSKKRRVRDILENYSTEELVFAARLSLYRSGRRDAASVVREICQEEEAEEETKKTSTSTPNLLKYTPDEALALFVDGKYTRHSYTIMQKGAKSRQADIYPSYEQLLAAKKRCYPPPEYISVEERAAQVQLQALADHTVRRLTIVQEEVLKNYLGSCDSLELIYKWGCDGSGGHSSYKQAFEDETSTDFYLYSVCCVPLRLQTSGSCVPIWNNPRSSSTRFCRPMKILFEKESPDLIQREIEFWQNEIKLLVPTELEVFGKNIQIKHIFKLTMIDGKTFGVLSKTPSSRCGICGALPKEMNDLEGLTKRVSDSSMFEYGISSLHAYIRTFECLMNIAYRLEVKKWRIVDEHDKSLVEERKIFLRTQFKKEGLIIDVPKPGYGTSNDGNTAARFFENPSVSSSISGIDENLIRRLGAILQAISSGYSINLEKFKLYTWSTAEQYINLYAWYPMPPTMHKLLLHGPDIINSCSLPIGMFSEEALECRNKDLRRFRERNSRKTSRKDNITDLFNALLFSSDPLISSISRESSKSFTNTSPLPKEVLSLIAEPCLPGVEDTEEF